MQDKRTDNASVSPDSEPLGQRQAPEGMRDTHSAEREREKKKKSMKVETMEDNNPV